MLALPERGFARSVDRHNVELDVLCDWIEGSLLFSTGRVSQPDVADVLCETNVYSRKEFANDRVSDAWSELRKRQTLIGHSSPYRFEGLSVFRDVHPWKDAPAHSFCVMLSMAEWHPKWAGGFGRDYTEQGRLFEDLTKEAVENLFLGWRVCQTGWSRSSPRKLAGIVDTVASLLDETVGDVKKWTTRHANEAGLDLVCWNPFPDGRGCYPTLLFQCASGSDWPKKLEAPDLKVWTRLVGFRAQGFPRKAFSTPLALLDEEFDRACNKVDGLLMDRYRLLAPGLRKQNWVSTELAQRIGKWAKPRQAKLPLLS